LVSLVGVFVSGDAGSSKQDGLAFANLHSFGDRLLNDESQRNLTLSLNRIREDNPHQTYRRRKWNTTKKIQEDEDGDRKQGKGGT